MKLIESRKLLYDGLETDELHHDATFTVHGHTFSINEMLPNEIMGLKTQLTHADFQQLVTTSGFLTNNDLGFQKDAENLQFMFEEFYHSADGLSLYYVFKNSLLYLFSFGEKQPARYMLYSEGVWQIDATDYNGKPEEKEAEEAHFNDNEQHTNIAPHNLARLNKDISKLFKAALFCAAVAIVCLLLHANGAGSLFAFFFIAVFLCLLYAKYKQDLSQPAFSIAERGITINQQFLRNSFVPWAHIAKVALRGHNASPAIIITFNHIDTLLKGQFFVLKSIAKANLLPHKTIVISHLQTIGKLNHMYEIMLGALKPYTPDNTTSTDTPLPHTENNEPLQPNTMYVRLENRMTQPYYREIVAAALTQAAQDYSAHPDYPFHESFYNQLKDIQLTVIEQNVVYTEDEAYKKYPMSIMAMRNFEGDEREYLKQISDIVWGIAKYPEMPAQPDYKGNLQDEFNEIEIAFAPFFKQHNFQLRSADPLQVVYMNRYSELIFDFDSYGSRFGYIVPATVFYRNKKSNQLYSIKSMIETLHHLDFKQIFTQHWDEKRLGYYGAYKEIIQLYLNNVINDADFLWEEKFKKE